MSDAILSTLAESVSDSHLSMYVHASGDQYVSQSIADKGEWEIYETQLIKGFLSDGASFVDVGANIGYYSVVASQIVGAHGSVVSFEPEMKNFQLLSKNSQLNESTNIHAVNAGLAIEDRESEIYLSTDNWGDHQIYDGGDGRTSSPIKLVNGDRYLAAISHEQQPFIIDVLKIDTQGAEFKVLKGLEATIRQSLPGIKIVIEFWPYGLRQAGDHAHKVLDILLSLQLPIAIIDHIDHRLIPCQESDLRPWIDELDKDSTNQGFMNLLVG